jgi:hypothetical protein
MHMPPSLDLIREEELCYEEKQDGIIAVARKMGHIERPLWQGQF